MAAHVKLNDRDMREIENEMEGVRINVERGSKTVTAVTGLKLGEDRHGGNEIASNASPS
jgi:hypothetical protein